MPLRLNSNNEVEYYENKDVVEELFVEKDDAQDKLNEINAIIADWDNIQTQMLSDYQGRATLLQDVINLFP